jgi:glucosamine--fructose-6-phosphate aminotransferase (isomerizing)
MNIADKKYNQYVIRKEMLETVEIIRKFNPVAIEREISKILNKIGLYLIGEGSSQIFPAKHAFCLNHMKTFGYNMFTEGSSQAMEYKLDNYAVFNSSNSGKTKELIQLLSYINIRIMIRYWQLLLT